MRLITIARGGDSRPIKMAFEDPDDPIIITNKIESERALYELINSVEPFDTVKATIDLDLIKNTHFGVISI